MRWLRDFSLHDLWALILLTNKVFCGQIRDRTFRLCNVKQQRNRPAHILAQYTEGIDTYVTWIEENPSMLESALTQDVLNISLLNESYSILIKKKKKKRDSGFEPYLYQKEIN